MIVQIAALMGAALVLYLLIKGHLYVARKAWEPVFEEQVADEREDAESDREDVDDRSGAADGTAWDHVR